MYTDENNTLCGADGCNSNCHFDCLLPRQGDHKVTMCDKDIIKLCHCMDEKTFICTVCHHSYEKHYNIKYKFEKKCEQVTYLNAAANEKYEEAISDEERATLMKEQLDNEHAKAEEEVRRLSEALINKVKHFEGEATAPSYMKVIECQLMMVEYRMKLIPFDERNSTLRELTQTKKELEEKLKLVKQSQSVATGEYNDPGEDTLYPPNAPEMS